MKAICWVAVLLVVGVGGCKSDEEKIVDAYKDKLKAQFAKIAALAPKVEKESPLTTQTWPVTGVKWSSNIFTDPNGNAIWAWSHQLVDACTNRNATYAKDNSGSDYIFFTDTQVSTAGKILETPKCAVDGKMESALGLDERAVKYLIAAKYMLVVRPHVKQPPKLDQAEVDASLEEYRKTGKGKDVEHFVPGRIAGDALLYELDTGKLVGGFTFDAKNSDEIKVASDSAGIREMFSDLTEQLEAQLAAKLRM